MEQGLYLIIGGSETIGERKTPDYQQGASRLMGAFSPCQPDAR